MRDIAFSLYKIETVRWIFLILYDLYHSASIVRYKCRMLREFDTVPEMISAQARRTRERERERKRERKAGKNEESERERPRPRSSHCKE